MKFRALLLAAALTAAGCASSSGINEISPGAYRTSSSAWTSMGGSATAEGDALKKAAAHCQSMGKRLDVTNQTGSAQITGATTDVTFRCI